MPSDRAAPPAAGSIIDSLGVEIVGVMSPVSICMLLVVVLISALAPPPSSAASAAPPPITAANLVYQESPSDPPSQKLAGSLLNAAAFVAFVAAATFLLALLYYCNLTPFLIYYMRFSAFTVLASLGGSIALSVLRRYQIPLDAVTAGFLLFNAAAVGTVAVLSPAVPIVLRQSCTVALGVVVAAWFALLPEWTTWTLLVALAGYDLVAVLAPGGPLRILVELASERDEDLPAFIYEARPTIPTDVGNFEENSRLAADQERSGRVPELEMVPVSDPDPNSSAVEITHLEETSPLVANQEIRSEAESEGVSDLGMVPIADESLQLRTDPNPSVRQSRRPERIAENTNHSVVEIENLEETSPLVGNGASGNCPERSEISSELEMFDSSRGIRLGLGDFIFYSVLVGRAAMYDLMTVYACYLAIVAGLGCTLILLSVRRQALPALPISILFGVVFYFLTRLLMEPFVVGASASLVNWMRSPSCRVRCIETELVKHGCKIS